MEEIGCSFTRALTKLSAEEIDDKLKICCDCKFHHVHSDNSKHSPVLVKLFSAQSMMFVVEL